MSSQLNRSKIIGLISSKVFNCLSVLLYSFVGNIAPARAEQVLYAQTSAGWFIYKEQQSCAAYLDFPNGLMLRFSHRVDEKIMYFNIHGSELGFLKPRVGENVQLMLGFDNLAIAWAAYGVVNELPGGRLGVTSGGLPDADLLMAISSSPNVNIDLLPPKPPATIAKVKLSGGDIAAFKLMDCSRKHFGY